MALSDKNIVITPNIGAASDPKIVFSGADASTGPQNITVTVYPLNGGTLTFDGSIGQLFSVTNSMTGTIYSVNDISGIPSFEVLDTGLVKLAQYSGNVVIGSATDNGSKLQVTGSITASGTITGANFAGGTYATSDRRAKDNIRSLEYGLKDVLQLMPKKFEMKKDGSTSIGLIAQDVEKLIPEVVAQISDEYLGINYSLLVSVLINAVKELKEEIDELKLNIK